MFLRSAVAICFVLLSLSAVAAENRFDFFGEVTSSNPPLVTPGVRFWAVFLVDNGAANESDNPIDTYITSSAITFSKYRKGRSGGRLTIHRNSDTTASIEWYGVDGLPSLSVQAELDIMLPDFPTQADLVQIDTDYLASRATVSWLFDYPQR